MVFFSFIKQTDKEAQKLAPPLTSYITWHLLISVGT